MACSGAGGGRGERDLVLQIVGSLKCRNLGWSIDLRCSCCRGAPWSTLCELVYVRLFSLCKTTTCVHGVVPVPVNWNNIVTGG